MGGKGLHSQSWPLIFAPFYFVNLLYFLVQIPSYRRFCGELAKLYSSVSLGTTAEVLQDQTLPSLSLPQAHPDYRASWVTSSQLGEKPCCVDTLPPSGKYCSHPDFYGRNSLQHARFIGSWTLSHRFRVKSWEISLLMRHLRAAAFLLILLSHYATVNNSIDSHHHCFANWLSVPQRPLPKPSVLPLQTCKQRGLNLCLSRGV